MSNQKQQQANVTTTSVHCTTAMHHPPQTKLNTLRCRVKARTQTHVESILQNHRAALQAAMKRLTGWSEADAGTIVKRPRDSTSYSSLVWCGREVCLLEKTPLSLGPSASTHCKKRIYCVPVRVEADGPSDRASSSTDTRPYLIKQ